MLNGVFDDMTNDVTGGSSADLLAGIAIVDDTSDASTEGVWILFDNGVSWEHIDVVGTGSALMVTKIVSFVFPNQISVVLPGSNSSRCRQF